MIAHAQRRLDVALGLAETERAIGLYTYRPEAPEAVERCLNLPGWLATHDQGREGACVGHGIALERAMVNSTELHDAGHAGYRRYDPISLWQAAKDVDEYAGTHSGDNQGTSVRAGYEIARTVGLRRVRTMRLQGETPVPVGLGSWFTSAGVDAYLWATSIDAIRAAIAAGRPVTIGVQWYAAFDAPIAKGRERWLVGSVAKAGRVRGAHCLVIAGASDRRQAFELVNSWGAAYPPVWLPYSMMEALLGQQGEAALVTDRVGE